MSDNTKNRHEDVGIPDDLRVALNVAIADVGVDFAGVPILADYPGFLRCLKEHGFEIVKTTEVESWARTQVGLVYVDADEFDELDKNPGKPTESILRGAELIRRLRKGGVS